MINKSRRGKEDEDGEKGKMPADLDYADREWNTSKLNHPFFPNCFWCVCISLKNESVGQRNPTLISSASFIPKK